MALAAKRHGASAAPPLRWPVDRVLPGILPMRETCPWPEGGHPHRWNHCAREEHQGRGHEIGDSRHIAGRCPRHLAVTIPRPITEAEGNKRLSRGVEGALLSWRPGLHTFSVLWHRPSTTPLCFQHANESNESYDILGFPWLHSTTRFA